MIDPDKPGMVSYDNKDMPRGNEITSAINTLKEITSGIMGETTTIVVAVGIPQKHNGLIRTMCLTEDGSDLLENAKVLYFTLGGVEVMIAENSPLAAVDLSGQKPN